MHAVQVMIHALWFRRSESGCQRLRLKYPLIEYFLRETSVVDLGFVEQQVLLTEYRYQQAHGCQKLLVRLPCSSSPTRLAVSRVVPRPPKWLEHFLRPSNRPLLRRADGFEWLYGLFPSSLGQPNLRF